MNSEKKNILIIAYNDLNNSGVPNVIYQIIKTQQKDYNFDILIFGNDLYYFEKLKNEGINGIDVIKSKDKKPQNIVKKSIYYLFKRNKNFYRETLKILKNKKYDVVHSFKEYDSGPFLKAAKKVGINKRIIHTTVIHDQTLGLINNKNKKLSLKYANVFVGVTELACRFAFPNKPFKVIHFNYDERKFNREVELKINDDQLFLTQVATFSSNKNQLFSIEIMRHLKELHSNTKLKLIGKETEFGYQRKILDAINRYNLKREVELFDGKNGVGNNLEYTSYCLLTSLKEGASLVVVEAQACGITTFVSSTVSKEMNVGGIKYLDLEKGPKYWAEEIYNFFKQNGNKRSKYDLSSFSKTSFSKAIDTLYKN